ncbi:MAG: aminomethyl-transferring glycine dehydrogenase subunit GcvPB [Candidatus Bipolaricaulia bacterium]
MGKGETIFDRGAPGRRGISLPKLDVREQPAEKLIPAELLRSEAEVARLPEVSQPEVVRHYVRLSQKNFGIDTGFYPLGSCTMKYNPKVNEETANNPRWRDAHPLMPGALSQGSLRLMYELGERLRRIGGMDAITLQPAAGAHGELTGMSLIKKYFEVGGELNQRHKILVPDSAHGTNPASVTMAGFETVQIPSNERGTVDLKVLEQTADEATAGIMLTVPNTLGIFEDEIVEITGIVHEVGGLCYFDGANLNAFLGRARPGDMGADIVHYNLHKTFSTPHGGGGPGAGPVGVVERLAPFLPVPIVVKDGNRYRLDYDRPESIGKLHNFYGNFAVLVRAYTYIRALGDEGLRAVSENAVLNANYLKERLKRIYRLPYDRLYKHEFVLSGVGQGEDVHTIDIAKRLLDYGFHSPTIYFPLIVPEALMIEPTETESKETLDAFAEALEEIAQEAKENPELLKQAPHTTPVRRLDEVRAARHPILTYPFED